ncbi:MAG: hypothetical protein M1816_002691 [Peltula sp. TS41687]|nr:MAG: hypothetical protein M1816_002691 [Peltula sp. TS41687]
MPLFTHHPSLSWPPLSHISSRTHRSGSPKEQASIDEDPFAYFITPPPITDFDEEESIFEDWSAGIPPTGRPRARSLSPFRLRNRSVIVQDDYDADDQTVITISPPKSPQSPTPMRTLRRWIHHFPSPRAPRIQPQELSIDDVPPLSPLSASPPSSPPPESTCFSPRGRSRRDMRPIRSHSNRPRVWAEPDEMLWTVLEEENSDLEDHEQWGRISTVLPPTNSIGEGGEVMERTTTPAKKSRSKGTGCRRLFKRPRLH